MSTLVPVINATGIVIHTNLGRTPISDGVLDDIRNQVTGYTTVEYSIAQRRRGHRSVHLKEALNTLTGAENSAVVNNNAAAVILVLKALAEGRDVIISRSELIEIGGSFRIPEIMEASGARMIEVGSTNYTTLEDYEQAITSNTALIFKAHHSNFSIGGYCNEVSVEELVALSKKHHIPFYYDLGSGLMHRPSLLKDIAEIDIRSAVQMGVDVVTFSTDKLYGGCQGGIIIGKEELVAACESDPLMRALRVGKVTIAALKSLTDAYLNEKTLFEKSPLHRILDQSHETIQKRAKLLRKTINKKFKKQTEVVSNKAQVGGGTLPYFFIDSFAVKIKTPDDSVKKREQFSEALFAYLHTLDKPIIPILKEGYIFFDCLTIADEQVDEIAKAVTTFMAQYPA